MVHVAVGPVTYYPAFDHALRSATRSSEGSALFDSHESITELVSLLEARQASLWHACQLVDFVSYVAVGGIPSRQRLERERKSFTAFASDAGDRRHGLWDKVFLNLSDFGSAFASGATATPNPYGPIAIQIRPSALLAATDVAVCLRSAGAADFDRNVESLDSVSDVDRIYSYPIAAGFPRCAQTRIGERLRSEFAERGEDATACEVSCTIPRSLAAIEFAVVVWVDPISSGGHRLIDRVRDEADTAGMATIVRERLLTTDRMTVMREVTALVADEHVRLRLVPGRRGISDLTRIWANELINKDLDWQFDRYAGYLRSGTLAPLDACPLRPLTGTPTWTSTGHAVPATHTLSES